MGAVFKKYVLSTQAFICLKKNYSKISKYKIKKKIPIILQFFTYQSNYPSYIISYDIPYGREFLSGHFDALHVQIGTFIIY